MKRCVTYKLNEKGNKILNIYESISKAAEALHLENQSIGYKNAYKKIRNNASRLSVSLSKPISGYKYIIDDGKSLHDDYLAELLVEYNKIATAVTSAY